MPHPTPTPPPKAGGPGKTEQCLPSAFHLKLFDEWLLKWGGRGTHSGDDCGHSQRPILGPRTEGPDLKCKLSPFLLAGLTQGVQRQVRKAEDPRPQTQGLRLSPLSHNNLISTAKLLFLLAGRRNAENEKCVTSVSLGSRKLLMTEPSQGLRRKPTWPWLLGPYHLSLWQPPLVGTLRPSPLQACLPSALG